MKAVLFVGRFIIVMAVAVWAGRALELKEQFTVAELAGASLATLYAIFGHVRDGEREEKE